MSVTAPRGIVASAASAGIKARPASDLALVATDDSVPVPAAAVFTANKMTAAPVRVTAAHLAATGGRAAAVVLNSGNANAATGAAGREDAEATTAAVAAELGCAPEAVLVCSTGLIGSPLPMAPITRTVSHLVAHRGAHGGGEAAEALMTTDTRRKEAVARAGEVTVGGMAKGAAMLAPDMATMLAVLTTDAAAEPEALTEVLRTAVAGSFNTLVVDGCTSTNDTVILLATGRAAGARGPGDADGPRAGDLDALGDLVSEVCGSLAAQMAADAEGATKVVCLRITGAANDAEADTGARAVATSQLTKCSWYGCDPYWGRVASDLGSAGIAFDPDRLRIAYGPHVVAEGGVAAPHDAAALTGTMAARELELTVDLGLGSGAATIITNDLTHAYVDENMRTS